MAVKDIIRRDSILAGFTFGKGAQYQSLQLIEPSGLLQSRQHSVDAIGALPDIFDHENGTFQARGIRRSIQCTEDGKITADERSFGLARTVVQSG